MFLAMYFKTYGHNERSTWLVPSIHEQSECQLKGKFAVSARMMAGILPKQQMREQAPFCHTSIAHYAGEPKMASVDAARALNDVPTRRQMMRRVHSERRSHATPSVCDGRSGTSGAVAPRAHGLEWNQPANRDTNEQAGMANTCTGFAPAGPKGYIYT